MITMQEIIKDGTKLETMSPEIQANLLKLLDKLNLLRKIYNKPMIISSGLRSMEDHLRIYKSKGITDPKRIPMKSNHLFGLAVDIYDPKQEFQKWIMENLEVLESLDLYLEDFKYTPTWCHIQIVAPSSKKRFFIPWKYVKNAS